MANLVYPKALQQMLSLMLNATNIKVAAVNVSGTGTLYTYSASHTFLSDIPGASIIATSGNLASLTFTDGTFDAADLVPAFTAMTGTQIEAIVIYIDTGVGSTSRLLAYFDTATGLPLTPTGSNVDATWNASGIFTI